MAVSLAHTTFTMIRFKIALIAVALFGAPSHSWGGHTITTQQQSVLDQWLAAHPKFRLATDADCACPEDIEETKTMSEGVWKPIPDYHPYSVTGDFNSDSVLDFASVVVERAGSIQNATLLIFNGPFATKDTKPAFIESDLKLQDRGLFFGPPRPKPYRLVLGPFESDNTMILIPHKHTYSLSY